MLSSQQWIREDKDAFPSSAVPHSQLDFLPNGHESCKLQQNGRGRIKSVLKYRLEQVNGEL